MERMDGRKGKRKKEERKEERPTQGCHSSPGWGWVAYVYWLFDAGVSVRNVAWEGAAGESFARGVAPSAGEVIICAKSELGACGEGGKRATVLKHGAHTCHLTGIKCRQIQIHKFTAAIKHEIHICNLCSIKCRHIQVYHATASTKHTSHIRDIRSIKCRHI